MPPTGGFGHIVKHGHRTEPRVGSSNSPIPTHCGSDTILLSHEPAQQPGHITPVYATAQGHGPIPDRQLHRRDAGSNVGLTCGLTIAFLILGMLSCVWLSRRRKRKRRRRSGKHARSNKYGRGHTYSEQIASYSYRASHRGRKKNRDNSRRGRSRSEKSCNHVDSTNRNANNTCISTDSIGANADTSGRNADNVETNSDSTGVRPVHPEPIYVIPGRDPRMDAPQDNVRGGCGCCYPTMIDANTADARQNGHQRFVGERIASRPFVNGEGLENDPRAYSWH